MSKLNPRPKCQICRLVHLMDETRRHPSGTNLAFVRTKLESIRTCDGYENWCDEHRINYKVVATTVEHWADRIEFQKENRGVRSRAIFVPANDEQMELMACMEV